VVQDLKHLSSYLAYNEFILYLDHEASKHLNSHDKLSSKHAGWAAYIRQFSFVIKYKSGALNKVADAISSKESLLTTMKTKVLGFDLYIESLFTNPYFGPIVSDFATRQWEDYVIHHGFIFKGKQLCVQSLSEDYSRAS
jgi:hypothetical protein